VSRWCRIVSQAVGFWVVVCWCVGVSVGWGFARVEGGPLASSAPGLPDGRVYELVSPAGKNGNEAGAGTAPFKVGAKNHYGLASPDGDAVLFEGTGPMGVSPWESSLWFVATKNQGGQGWSTHALLPQALQPENTLNAKDSAEYLDPSRDLTHAVVLYAGGGGLSPRPNGKCAGLWLVGPDPLVMASWLEQPGSGLVSPIENCEPAGDAGVPVGGTPDFSVVYFAYPGTLLVEDASRAPHSHGGELEEPVEAWGFYESAGGVLREAGVLPGGGVSAFGAVPAASGHGRNPYGNEVSADGSRVFFVSPDPASCEGGGGHNDCAVDPPELYVRENGERTQLVSTDTLLPDSGGLPAAAPTGPSRMPNPAPYQKNPEPDGSYVFASSDGSQAFFQSSDTLTGAAQAASPGSEPKTYDFDVDTGALTYLPGVEGSEIVAADSDGSSLAFVRAAAGGAPAELELWSAGPGGGSVTAVTELPEFPSVSVAQFSSDGATLVFQTAAVIAGFNNHGSHELETGGINPGSEEIYRYDVSGNDLGCLSCPPAGVVPRGNSSMSMLYLDEAGALSGYEPSRSLVNEANVSADGVRIFFESPDPLVPEDANTDSPPALVDEDQTNAQGRDVYEWEDGVVYLISTGASTRDSYLLDSSEDGDDVFIATTQSLVPADTDGGYDVYDARVPRAEDTPAPAANPCVGSTCQGPVGTVAAPAVSSSAGFSGSGNPAPDMTVSTSPSHAPAVVKKCKKGYVKKKKKCVRHKSKKKPAKALPDAFLVGGFLAGSLLGMAFGYTASGAQGEGR
jgi:hypothetical protein